MQQIELDQAFDGLSESLSKNIIAESIMEHKVIGKPDDCAISDTIAQKYIREYRNKRLHMVINRLMEVLETNDVTLSQSLSYFFSAQGKFIRPLLTLLACEAAGGDFEDAIDFACAVELIHSSSLIFDDLPCMDNADRRRGKICLHKRFNEGIAILTGIYFISKAFKISSNADKQNKGYAVKILSDAIDDNGLVSGQILDLARDNNYQEIIASKTTSLIVASIELGAYAAGAAESSRRALIDYAKRLGVIIQLRDDVLDDEGDIYFQPYADQIAEEAIRDILAEFDYSQTAFTLAAFANLAAKHL